MIYVRVIVVEEKCEAESTKMNFWWNCIEALNVSIVVRGFLTTVGYDYLNFHLIMHAYQCELLGEFHLQEHSAARWLNLETLYDVDWLEADLPIVECVKSFM